MALSHTANRIRYILPFPHSRPGHRLGINSLALDTTTVGENRENEIPEGILYSAGRDGVVSAWDLHLALKKRMPEVNEPSEEEEGDLSMLDDDGLKTKLDAGSIHESVRQWDVEQGKQSAASFRSQVQAHTNWVNDILLTHNSSSVVSCSSDMTVKLWRPHSSNSIPETLGQHADYVKVLASPGDQASWVASGGLDRKILLWDLNGYGEVVKIEVGEGGEGPKGSVYALGTGGGLLASGGPEKVIRVWDPTSGKRITKFVGHTDNVRSILISDDGRTMLTASSDTTIKIWSLLMRRCLHTLTMHNDSVWALHSIDPRLEVFHAGDRGGLVTKTDLRGVGDIDEAECVALYKEHHGVTKIVGVGDRLWSATSSSSINRWLDAPIWEQDISASISHRRLSSSSPHRPSPTVGFQRKVSPALPHSVSQDSIPPQSFLRLTSAHESFIQVGPHSNRDQDVSSVYTATAPATIKRQVSSEEERQVIPVRVEADDTIDGQHGLIKHILLNDRRRVLTLDTSHTVALWDIIECTQLESFGSRNIYEVEKQVNSSENVPNWCQVDTRIGAVTVMLEERTCFDAEVYADEMGLEDGVAELFKEDQRINIGKWVLRYLFANLIDAEIVKDISIRRKIEVEELENKKHRDKEKAENADQVPLTLHITVPPPVMTSRQHDGAELPTSHAGRAALDPLMSPAMVIGPATPMPTYSPTSTRTNILSPSTDGPNGLNRSATQGHTPSLQPTNAGISSPGMNFSTTPVSNRTDYFSSALFQYQNGDASSSENGFQTPTLGDVSTPGSPDIGGTKDSSFMKRFGWGKKGLKSDDAKRDDSTTLGGLNGDDSASTTDKAEEESTTHLPLVPTSPPLLTLTDVLAKIQKDYQNVLEERYNAEDASTELIKLNTSILPSAADDTPVIRPNPDTIIILAEQKPSVDGSMDLYRGTVECVGRDVDRLENVAPGWLGELLLLNKLPEKETVKISFSLKPHPSTQLPDLLAGNSRLNANRMLRARKILAYVAERVDKDLIPMSLLTGKGEDAEQPIQPDLWLQLLCQDKIVPSKWTLQTIRTHIWRAGGDVLFTYRLKSEEGNAGQEQF